jgi:hypothetical protein
MTIILWRMWEFADAGVKSRRDSFGLSWPIENSPLPSEFRYDTLLLRWHGLPIPTKEELTRAVKPHNQIPDF